MNALEILQAKIVYQKEDIERRLIYWRFRDNKIVFTNGCFDLIHRGHIEYLAKSSDKGHILIIGLNSDDSVKRLKGANRPLQDQQSRALALASFCFVSSVVIFNEDTPEELIRLIRPDVLVKGADYKSEEIAGYDFVTSYGGKVETVELTENSSTSLLIKKIRS